MPPFRCPHPSHQGEEVPLKSNNDRVFECGLSHRFYRRQEKDGTLLVDLITSDSFPAVPMKGDEDEPAAAPQLNFMTDVPRVVGNLDFNDLSLEAQEWKLLAKVDGRSTLEEVRLLSGMRAEDAEKVIRRLVDAGILEIRGRR